MVKSGTLVKVDYAAKVNGEVIEQRKNVVIAVGKGQVVKGFDEALQNAVIGKKVTAEVPCEKAYGKRQLELVRLISMDVFRRQGVEPLPGMPVELDGLPAKVQSVSGGRVRVDFNHDLAGKDVTYEFTISEELKTPLDAVTAITAQFFKDNDIARTSYDEKTKMAVILVNPDTSIKQGYLLAKGKTVSSILRYVDEVKSVQVIEEYTKAAVVGEVEKK